MDMPVLRSNMQGRRALVLTCEHASNRLPAPWRWPEADHRLVGDHWAYDPGASELTQELALRLDAPAVLANFTRLLVDPNRATDDQDLFRTVADGRPVRLNEAISDTERAARIAGFWEPYHAAVDAAVKVARPRLLVSIHSYTTNYEGQPRAVELGVLHRGQLPLATAFRDCLARTTGRDVRINEPWSGELGLIYSAERHATTAGCPAMEFEFRNDLLREPGIRREFAGALVSAIDALGF
ncbi:MAG: N-formylglutamate amidohydrolase [Myxococcales bacterium]|nr:N-formylglutamate amidohydrolase [Myxococcales bacterium]